MREIKKRHSMDVFFVLCIFLFCAISLLGMVFVGARTQQKINQSTEENFHMRTSLMYISNKAKFFHEEGKISIENFEGMATLVFEEEIDGIKYTTKVYMYDGCLMELFTEKDYKLGADSGTIITELSSFEVKEINDGLIEVTVESPQGKKGSVLISGG